MCEKERQRVRETEVACAQREGSSECEERSICWRWVYLWRRVATHALMSRPEVTAILKTTRVAGAKACAAARLVVTEVNAPHWIGRPSWYLQRASSRFCKVRVHECPPGQRVGRRGDSLAQDLIARAVVVPTPAVAAKVRQRCQALHHCNPPHPSTHPSVSNRTRKTASKVSLV